jgi:hypothetical protein
VVLQEELSIDCARRTPRQTILSRNAGREQRRAARGPLGQRRDCLFATRAIVFGHRALRYARRRPWSGAEQGTVPGLALGYLFASVVVGVVLLVLVLSLNGTPA